MKLKAKQCLYGLLVCALTAGTMMPGKAWAQSNEGGTARVSDLPTSLPPEQAPTGYMPPFVDDGGMYPLQPVETWFAPRFFVDSRAGVLYGYQESYTNFGGFVPYFIEEDAMLFADARGLVSYDGRGGANLGLGWRYYMPHIDRFLGLSAWYDFDAGHVRSYNQLGVSFESIGRYADFRLNGYIPVGEDQHQLSTAVGGPVQFFGNGLFLTRYNEIETAYTGFDAEVGGPMPILGRYGLSGYTGFYFFNGSNGSDFTGVSGRLSWQVNEDWQIGVNVTDDHVFGSNAQMQVAVTLPDGKSSRWLRPLSVRDRMMQSVYRNFRVTVEHAVETNFEAAINPKDNQPYFVVHVDPNVADPGVAAGTGTVDNPYNLLSQFNNLQGTDKSKVDIIYVDPRGDDTSTNLNTGVTLLTGQRLLSSSVPHTFQAVQAGNTQFDIPGFAFNGTTKPLPQLSNITGGNVVTLADGAFCVEVSGFEINGSATGSGIVGTNNRNVLINRNVIQGGLDGIRLTNLTGTQDLNFGSFINQNIIRNNLRDGINVSNSGVGPLDLVIANNPPLDIDRDGALEIDTPGVDANDVDTNNNGVIDATEMIADQTAPDSLDGDGTYSNDGINLNGDDGIDINADAGSVITLAIDTNQIRGNGDNGIEIDATAASTIRGAITNNIVTGSQNNGLLLTANNSTLDFLNVINLPGGATLLGEISGNQFRNNVDDGIEILAQNSSLGFDINTNVFGDPTIANSGNGGYGVNYQADGGQTLIIIGGNVATLGNTFFDNGFGGINFDISGDNLTTTNIQFNTITEPTAGGGGGGTRSTFDQNTLAPNDDGSTGLVPVGFNGNFFGLMFSQVYVNNNGNITFNAPLPAFTPFPILTTGVPIIAPFFADVDTRANGLPVTYGTGTVNGQAAFGVNWNQVDYFSSSPTHGNQLNSFQLVLIDRSDVAPGDFDIEYNYNQILWETGNASGGTNGLGGSSARVGYSNGTTTSFELPGSAIPNSFLDSSPAATSLVQNSLNSNVPGRYLFQARNGVIVGPGNGGSDLPPGTPNNGGIQMNLSGTAQLNNSTILDNTVRGLTNSAGNRFALTATTNNLSQINNLTVSRNSFTMNNGGILLDRNDSSRIGATITNNAVNNNTRNGLEIQADGTAVGGVFLTTSDNTFNQNTIDGLNIRASENARVTMNSSRDTFSTNGDQNIDVITTDNAIVNLSFANISADSATNDGFNATVGGTSVLNLNFSNPTDPLLIGTATGFSGNGGNGFTLSSIESGLAIVQIDGLLFDNNTVDGLNFNREGASLILAQLNNATITNNNDDGVQFYASGADRTDATTPLFNVNTGMAPSNRLVITNSILDTNGVIGAENGGNGIETATSADAVFVLNVVNTAITTSATDGVRAFSTASSSFGTANDRVTFDGVTITGSGRDGIKLFAMGQFDSEPTQFVDVVSNSGVTLIDQNGDDGIQASVPYGTIDLNVTGQAGSTFTTLIQRSGDNGIEFNVSDVAIDGDDANDITAGNPSMIRVDGDADGAGNEILNFFFANGFEFSDTDGFNGNGVLNISNVALGDNNLNDATDRGNGGNGVEIFVSNIWNFVGGGNDGIGIANSFVGPGTDSNGVVYGGNAAANQHDVNRDGNVDVAFGAGSVGRNIIGDQAGHIDFTMDNSLLSGNGVDGLQIVSDGNNATFDQGNIVNATVTNNVFSTNGRDGVNIDLEGRHGTTSANDFTAFFGGDYQVTETNQFIFTDNVIERNNNYGFRYQANAGIIRRVNFGTNADTYFWSTQFNDPQPTNPNGPFNPLNVAGTTLGPIFNTSDAFEAGALDSNYFSIATDLNSNLVFNRNTVRFNGQSNQAFNEGGDGLFIRTSTNSYLSADIGGQAGSGNGNTFSGNALADVRFESFTATWVNGITSPVPNASTAAVAPGLDQIFLDDTAQLTLRFNNNTGREVSADAFLQNTQGNIGSRSAAYNTNNTAFIGTTGGVIRQTQMFQVDDGFNLDTTNSFTTSLPTEFSGSGGWYLVPIADPAFPNPIFPQSYFEDPGSPFFP